MNGIGYRALRGLIPGNRIVFFRTLIQITYGGGPLPRGCHYACLWSAWSSCVCLSGLLVKDDGVSNVSSSAEFSLYGIKAAWWYGDLKYIYARHRSKCVEFQSHIAKEK